MTPYWRRYASYLAVGAVVGLITIALREALALVVGDTPFTYSVSVGIAYGCGIVVSFIWQARFTFRSERLPLRGRFGVFVVLAVAAALLTAVLSRLIRYGLSFDRLFGVAGAGLAFAGAALLTSIVSYAMNARFVFGADSRAAPSRK